jgi:hypothetical protein
LFPQFWNLEANPDYEFVQVLDVFLGTGTAMAVAPVSNVHVMAHRLIVLRHRM